MAQNRTIDQAIDELVKDYKRVAERAAKYATKKMKDDIFSRSLKILQKYYDNYTRYTGQPKSYDRTYRLQDSFVPFSNVTTYNDKILCSMGIIYDYARLDGYYYGSKQYQPTDSEWIVDNYLSGIHPTTNGSSILEDVEYIPIKDEYSPTYLMDGYLDICKKKFSNYMMISFMDQLFKR